MRLKFTINRQSYRDEPAFPGIEPDGTSTSNPALFPGTIIADTFDNFYVGGLDWVLGSKLFANVTVGVYDYGRNGTGAGDQLRHVFSNFQFPEIPAALQNVSGNEAENFLLDPNLKPIRTRELTFGLDHELTTTISLGVRYSRKRFDRTIEDTGVLVPNVGEVYRITNPSEGIGENVLRDFAGCTNCPNQPKPTRNYDGVEFRLLKRFSDRWSLTSTYIYSRLYGNYSGLTSSDENNRNSPSVNRFFDGQYYSFDHRGQPVFGLLQTDRPHVFKIEGTYDLPWGTSVGLYWLAETGTPLQTQMSEKGIPFYPFGRGDLGRTPMLTRTDLYIQHTFRLWGKSVNLGLNVENLLDQDIVQRRATTPYRDGFNVTDQAFFSGTFDPVAMAAATPATYRPNATFNLADQYQLRREMRLQASFRF